jgi:hypothetical protein
MAPRAGRPARPSTSSRLAAAAAAGLLLAAVLPPGGADPLAASGQSWVLRSRADFADARLEGLTLLPEGRLLLAPDVAKLADSPEPFLWSLAVDGKGRIHAAGGNEGQVVRIGPSGAEVIFDAPEVEVHALAFDAAGRLHAGSSPDGKVYRIADGGGAEVAFDPEAVYIWALAFDGAGDLLVATGQPGQILKVSPAGRSEVILDAREDHVRTLVPDGKGGFLAGSDGGGVIYRIGADGKASVLYDTPAREIAALEVLGGDVYAATLQPSPQGRPAGEGRGPVTRVRVTAEGGSEVQDENEGQPEGAQRAQRAQPPETFSGAVYRIGPQGYARKIWESREALPLALLAAADGRLLVGTGDRGRVLALSPDGDAGDLSSLEASQVNALARGPGGDVLAATSNLGAVFRLSGRFRREGSITGTVRDAGFTSRWGALTWEAETPAGTEVSFEVRTGDTESPDATWSDWSKPIEPPRGGVVDRPAARYLQWRATLRSEGGATPIVKAVQIHYLPENMPPAVESVEVLAPGVLLQSSGPPSGGDEGGDGPPRRASQPKRSFQKGMRSVSWKATDANGDALRAEVQYRAEDETVWKTLEAGAEDDFLAWDSTAMPDGVYRLRVVVSDGAANPPGRGLTGQRESAPFDVDNTPPAVAEVKARLGSRSAEVTAVVSDTFSVVGEVAYSVDASEWTVVLPEDGVADSGRETFRFATRDLAPGEHSIVIRARDRAGNAASGKVIVRVP